MNLPMDLGSEKGLKLLWDAEIAIMCCKILDDCMLILRSDMSGLGQEIHLQVPELT